ncbi:MAG: hypothetical protein NDJ90_01105 [Oligoflexia bacterium]|nr:hypothetical protein [Oligoflexia bacterium]
MKTLFRFLTSGVAAVMVASVVLAGCQDKSLEDYKRDKMNQDLAKYDGARGSYQGTAISKRDGSALGHLTARVKPRKGDKPYLDVRLTFEGATRAEMSFSREIDYDETTGDYEGQVTLQRLGDEPVQLRLFGNFSNGTFSGDLSANDFDDYGLEFMLTRFDAGNDAPDPNARKGSEEEGLPTDPAGFVSDYYYGEIDGLEKGSKRGVFLNVRMNIPSPEQEFVSQFIPKRRVQLTMAAQLSDGNLGRVFADFPTAEWDLRRNRISGAGQGKSPGSSERADLFCVEKTFSDAVKGWTCKYVSGVPSSRGGFVADFRPVEIAQ